MENRIEIDNGGKTMGAFEQLEPKSVFEFFEKICSIPHGSGNVGQISDYLVSFAKERGLEHYQDAAKNVIIIKEASEGYENEEPLILQGHMDMVAVKTPACDIDMKKDGLRIAVDGDWAYAEGTSLGGDDGIAVAYSLALLDSDTVKHPRLEVVITTEEETGMDGARAIDLSMLKGHRMLNLDSEEEGIFLASCAGGARVNCHVPVEREHKSGIHYELFVKGLQGGHSGEMIKLERGNSNVLAGRILSEVQDTIGAENLYLMSLEGGLADNAIPRETEVQLLVLENQTEVFEAAVRKSERDIQNELATKDPDFQVSLTRWEKEEADVMNADSARKVTQVMLTLPNGVQANSADVPGLVETSLNMGVVKTGEKEVSMHFSVRSSVESSKENLIRRIYTIVGFAGGHCDTAGTYPGWAFRKDSKLREKMVAIYEEMYGKTPEIQAIHAGLECGLLSAKISDLDCVSIGPDMRDIHTTEEKLSISSTKRVWEFVVEVVSRK